MIPIYIDDKGCEVSISQGIAGPTGNWLICRRKKTGSLQRIKSVPALPFEHKEIAIKTLEAYAAKKKFKFKEHRERL